MIVAVTRPTGPELRECELTHIDREPINVERAITQHAAYLGALRAAGARVVELPREQAVPSRRSATPSGSTSGAQATSTGTAAAASACSSGVSS